MKQGSYVGEQILCLSNHGKMSYEKLAICISIRRRLKDAEWGISKGLSGGVFEKCLGGCLGGYQGVFGGVNRSRF